MKLWKDAGHSKLHAKFAVVGGQPLHFIGHFNPAAGEFECHDAILAYASRDALTASHEFHGKIGTNTIFIAIGDHNGPIIEGQLLLPLSPASRVVGFGSWFENMTEGIKFVILHSVMAQRN